LFYSNHAAASSSASPPISPIIIIPSVSGSSTNLVRTSMKLVPLKGSPPIPTTVDYPSPNFDVWSTASYVKVPERDTTPILPGVWIEAGMIPILHSPGLMMPGQLGPISLVLFYVFIADFTLIISNAGMPSVMHTTNSISAATASRIASAAKGGGT
jgi:hypothetical protein